MKTLFTRALERELRPEVPQPTSAHFEIDTHGWPILKRTTSDHGIVTNDFINELRESEGI